METKSILHIHSYAPQTPTWILCAECINRVEQIRVVTVPHPEWGHDCHIEYVYVTPLGDRQVWMGGSCCPLDTCDSYIFQGNVITIEILEAMFMTQNIVTNRTDYYAEMEHEIVTSWPQLRIAPEVFGYCKEKTDAKDTENGRSE